MRAELTLAILAGGRGRRLGGVAKGLIRIQGRPVLERLLELRRLAAEVLLVADDPAPYAAFGLRAVPDVEAGRGAPGGVVSALLAATTPWVLIAACDMPFVTAHLAERLIAAAADAEVVAYRREGRLEPLFGLYRAALGAGWRARLGEDRSLRAMAESARLVSLDADEPRLLDSLNTPDDLARHGASR